MLRIRKALEKEANAIAYLHERHLSSGFLASLGQRFLSLLYKAMILSDDACVFIATEDSKVVGFVSGTISVKSFYRYFLKNYLFQSIPLLIPYIVRPAKVKKMAEVFLYSKTDIPDLPEAELLSIVVNPEYQGKDIAKDLFFSLVDYFHKKGVKRFKIIVGDKLERAKRFYEKVGCRELSKIEVHKGEISRVLIYDIGKVEDVQIFQ